MNGRMFGYGLVWTTLYVAAIAAALFLLGLSMNWGSLIGATFGSFAYGYWIRGDQPCRH